MSQSKPETRCSFVNRLRAGARWKNACSPRQLHKARNYESPINFEEKRHTPDGRAQHRIPWRAAVHSSQMPTGAADTLYSSPFENQATHPWKRVQAKSSLNRRFASRLYA